VLHAVLPAAWVSAVIWAGVPRGARRAPLAETEAGPYRKFAGVIEQPAAPRRRPLPLWVMRAMLWSLVAGQLLFAFLVLLWCGLNYVGSCLGQLSGPSP
jgi:hypothetical protein